jgi:hypothetical protein
MRYDSAWAYHTQNDENLTVNYSKDQGHVQAGI